MSLLGQSFLPHSRDLDFRGVSLLFCGLCHLNMHPLGKGVEKQGDSCEYLVYFCIIIHELLCYFPYEQLSTYFRRTLRIHFLVVWHSLLRTSYDHTAAYLSTLLLMCHWVIMRDAAVSTCLDIYPEAHVFVKCSLRWNCWESSTILDNAPIFSKVVIPYYAHASRENSYCSKSLLVFDIATRLNFCQTGR